MQQMIFLFFFAFLSSVIIQNASVLEEYSREGLVKQSFSAFISGGVNKVRI